MFTRVEFMNDFLAVNVEPGKTIQKVVEAAGSSLPFGCRDGKCGTCVVKVETGMEFLTDITEKEKEVLKTVGEPSDKARLACQMKIKTANGLVRIKY